MSSVDTLSAVIREHYHDKCRIDVLTDDYGGIIIQAVNKSDEDKWYRLARRGRDPKWNPRVFRRALDKLAIESGLRLDAGAFLSDLFEDIELAVFRGATPKRLPRRGSEQTRRSLAARYSAERVRK